MPKYEMPTSTEKGKDCEGKPCACIACYIIQGKCAPAYKGNPCDICDGKEQNRLENHCQPIIL